MYLAHHELESIIIILIAITTVKGCQCKAAGAQVHTTEVDPHDAVACACIKLKGERRSQGCRGERREWLRCHATLKPSKDKLEMNLGVSLATTILQSFLKLRQQ